MIMFLRYCLIAAVSVATALAQRGPQPATFEGQPALTLSNDKLQMTITLQGSAIASLIFTDDAEKLSPLWNPMRLALELGHESPFNGTLGHFVCVDGFGPVSQEERAAGLPGHGEAHMTRFDATPAKGGGNSASLIAKLPIAQEVFTRSFHMVDGENVVYVDSQLESLLGVDRPVNWAEHATVAAPFLQPGSSVVDLSGVRSQTRPYAINQATAKNGQNPIERRLASGRDFTWPMAPDLNGKLIDLRQIPDNPHYLDHATTLLDPARKLEWVTSLNFRKGLIYGYVFRREDYPWIQYWGNYPAVTQVVRGMEFGTQPYDVPRREAITMGSMFETPSYRWLPAKSKIESHFLLFYARVPEGFRKVDDVRLEDGRIIIEDRAAQKQVTLAASRGFID
jgi:hypothetical protein